MSDEVALRRIRVATSSDAEALHRVTQEAFREYARFPNPSSVLLESLADVRAYLEVCDGSTTMSQGAALLLVERYVVGAVRFQLHSGPSFIAFNRLAVHPEHRGAGLGDVLREWVEARGRDLGLREVRADARSQQPDNRPYYLARGYEIVGYSERYGIPDIRTHLRKTL